MLIVRCTAKLLARLKVRPESAGESCTTRLGDWYATILPIRPAHLVLLVNEGTRMAVVLPAREISALRKRAPQAILEVLRELGTPSGIIESGREAMVELRFDRTVSRSVLRTMNDFTFQMESDPAAGQSRDLLEVAKFLNRVDGVRVPQVARAIRGDLADPGPFAAPDAPVISSTTGGGWGC